MEYTIEEIQTMFSIVSAVVANSHIEQCSAFGNYILQPFTILEIPI